MACRAVNDLAPVWWMTWRSVDNVASHSGEPSRKDLPTELEDGVALPAEPGGILLATS